MPSDYRRDDDKRLITVTMTEPFSMADFIGVVERQAAEDTWSYALLYDLRSLETIKEASPVLQTFVDRLQVLGERIRQALAKSPDFGQLADHIEVAFTDDGLRVQLLEDSSGVFFETGSAHPRPAGVALLGLLGEQLATMPNTVMVDGYTDAVPYSNTQSTYTNWELSADRANASRRILIAGGLRDKQVAQVRGHADRDLRFPGAPTSPSNRRITITMLFDVPGDSLAVVDSLRRGTLGALPGALSTPVPPTAPPPDEAHEPAGDK